MTGAPTAESIFTWGAPPLKFGAGASDEIGFDLSQYDTHRVLVGGTLKQQRLLSTCPKDVDEHDIAAIFNESMENW